MSPGYSHADHSLNTIRYAERLKEFPNEEQYIKLIKEAGKEVPKPKVKAKAKPKPAPEPKAKPSKKEEKKVEKPPTGAKNKVVKRALWNNHYKESHEEELKVNGNKNGSNTPTYSNGTDDDNEEDQETLMRTKKGELEDWKLLKQTLRSGGEELIDVDLQEKVDMLNEKKEELISKHMKYIRQVAPMLKREGELITQVQGPESDEERYVSEMRKIVKQKLKIYQDLDRDLDVVDRLMREEEEAYNQVNKR